MQNQFWLSKISSQRFQSSYQKLCKGPKVTIDFKGFKWLALDSVSVVVSTVCVGGGSRTRDLAISNLEIVNFYNVGKF